MTGTDITITFLAGILINIITAAATYSWTSKRDREKYMAEQREFNERIADIAVSHLEKSYKAFKKAQMDVKADARRVLEGRVSAEAFSHILVPCKVSDLINILACRTLPVWQEQHNASNYQTTNEVL